MKELIVVVVMAVSVMLLLPACGETALPQGDGLAAKYPGDKGIAKNPAVVFADNFETETITWDGDVKHPKKCDDKARVHAGKYSYQLTAQPGSGAGAPGLVKWFDPGYDQVYARWYEYFAPDYDQGDLNHVGAALVGMHNHWLLGVAGNKPDGTDFFSTSLEPWRDWHRNPAPGELMFYTYYPEMKRDPDGNFWGNSFKPKEKFLIERGRWYCLEIMVKVNHPDKADGEQAFWVNGQLIGHFTGLKWRTVEDLKVNGFWMLLYIHNNPQTNSVWYDDVVLARSYIGPMKTLKGGKGK
jgi:hypothetical protein